MSDHGGALSRARAMAGPTRATIHRLTREANGTATVAGLAATLDLHPTAVRQHLAQLLEAGLVERFVLASSGRGRPTYAYRAIEDQPYQTLAGWLAEGMRDGLTPRETGRRVGAELVVSIDDPVEAILDETGRLGFEPELRTKDGDGDSYEIVLHACPFAAIAATDPTVICDLHHGLAEGLANAVGGALVEGLHVGDPHRGGCCLTIRRTGPGTEQPE